MASENGEAFVKNLAAFVRTHEKALANALQSRRGSLPQPPSTPASPDGLHTSFLSAAHSAGSLTAALSSAVFPFSLPLRPAKLTLTPHHLFYLLSRFEELGIDVGPMNVRLENIHAESNTPSNYVSFLNAPLKPQLRSGKDSDSIHSVSSVRSVMSNMSNFWTGLRLPAASTAKSEKARVALETDAKYLYSAFTKIPCLRLSQDRRARLIAGYEEFPFDTAVPLAAFKNVSALEIYDTDFRQLYGWDRMADQLRSLTIKRGNVDDPKDLLVNIVIDDVERRRRRSSKPHTPSTPLWSSSPCIRQVDDIQGASPGFPPVLGTSPRRSQLHLSSEIESSIAGATVSRRNQSSSPTRPKTSRTNPSSRKSKGPYEMRRTGSGSSESSTKSGHRPSASRSSSNLLALGILPPTKWRLLRHLSLADNGLTSLAVTSFSPLSLNLISLDLSSNLFAEIPDGLAELTMMRALNLSSCLIQSLASLATSPLPAIESFNLRANKLRSLLGLEKLYSLERLDLRENHLSDPAELGRLTSIPGIREIYVAGNPFTKTHPNCRVQIFNLFRSTPGYTEDIVIDGSGPSYSERKQLKDRVVTDLEPAKLSSGPSALSEAQVVRHPFSSTRLPAPAAGSGEQAAPTTEPSTNKLTKKRPQPRKRLVELSAEVSPTVRTGASASRQVAESSHQDIGVTPTRIDADDVPSRGSSLRRNPQRHDPQVISQSSDGASMSKTDNTELYRRKVEALKGEYGSDWLKALSDSARDIAIETATLSPPSLHAGNTYNAASIKQAVGTGARSIG